MYLVYFDEAGDDGLVNLESTSKLFTLTSLYMEESNWQSNFEQIRDIRKELYEDYGFSTSTELHTMKFLKGKGGIWHHNWSAETRLEILDTFFEGVSDLDLKIINVVIDKENLKTRDDILSSDNLEGALDMALTNNLNRIELDMKQQEGFEDTNRYINIVDRGREGAMAKISRKRQVYNPTPSHFEEEGTYSFELERIIEDPLPQDSKQSFFIQLADAVTTLLLLYAREEYDAGLPWSTQLPEELDLEKVKDWFDTLKPILNEQARESAEYGVVYEPEKRGSN